MDGKLRLVEGLALPSEKDEFKLRYYNTASAWVKLDALLQAFELTREDTADATKCGRRSASWGPHADVYHPEGSEKTLGTRA